MSLQALQALSREEKVLRAQTVLAQALAEHRPVVAWSGGKDSTALLHLALKMEPGIAVIYNNTLVDFPENRRYVHQLAQAWKVNLHIAKPAPGVSFWKVVKKYGYPMLGKRNTPGRQHLPETYARGLEAKGKHRQAQAILEGYLGSTCCEFLKERPYRAMMKALGADCNITGILAGESQLRTLTWLSKGEFYQDKRGMWKATPLATWTDADVEAYLAQHQVPPNPLYGMGYHRNGCWPCIPRDTLVLSDRGWEPVIRVGYIQLDGTLHPVSAHLAQGIRPLLKVTTHCGFELRATGNHRVLTMNPDGLHEFRALEELQAGDWVAIERGGAASSVRHTSSGELWGLLVGDGHSAANCVDLSVCDKDPDLFQQAAKLLFRVARKGVRVYHGPGAWRIAFNNARIAKRIQEAIYEGKEKQTPPFMMVAPLGTVAGYLRGLFESDGSPSGDIRFCNTSEAVVRDAQLLLLRLGIVSRRDVYVSQQLPLHRLYIFGRPSIRRFWETVGFLSQRKRGHFHPSGGGRGDRDIIPHQGNNLTSLAESIPHQRSHPLRHLFQARYTDRHLSWEGLSRIAVAFNLDGNPLAEIQRAHYFYDRVESILPSIAQEVWDLSIPGPEAYCSQGFISHNCLQDLAFADNKLAIMRLAHPKLWHFLIVDYGLGKRLIRIKLALSDGQADLFAERWGGDLEELLRQRPCFFDRL